MTLVLDIGCGQKKVPGSFGIDIIRLNGVDAIVDLFHLPLPFADNTFDEIYLNDVIEHLPNTIKIMEEIHRIARKDAKVFITVVNWNSAYTAADPTHVKAFTEISFDFFGGRPGRNYYTKARFDVERIKLQYNRNVKKVIRSYRIMRFLSHFLCNILEGLNFELRTIKEAAPEVVQDIIPAQLRCPICSGTLEVRVNNWLFCTNCDNNYPIIDNTPILLEEEAEHFGEDNLHTLPVPPYNRFPVIKDE